MYKAKVYKLVGDWAGTAVTSNVTPYVGLPADGICLCKCHCFTQFWRAAV